MYLRCLLDSVAVNADKRLEHYHFTMKASLFINLSNVLVMMTSDEGCVSSHRQKRFYCVTWSFAPLTPFTHSAALGIAPLTGLLAPSGDG